MKPPLQAFCVDYPGLARVLLSRVAIIPKYPFQPEIAQQILANPLDLTFTAVWDTGATHSVITPNAINKLNLSGQIIRYTKVRGVNSESEQPVYIVGGIVLPNNIIFYNWELTESNIGDDADLLIGMDIISNGELTISRKEGKTKFCFSYPPHHKPFDLVERNQRINK